VVFRIQLLLVLLLVGCATSMSRREQYIRETPSLTDVEKADIMAGRIWRGMTTAQAWAAFGSPYHWVQRSDGWTTWDYTDYMITFHDDHVTSWTRYR